MRAKSIYILRNLQRRRNTRNPTSRTQECSMNDKATKPAVASNSGFPVAESLPAFLTPRKNNIDEKTQKLRLGDNCTTHPFRNASISITAVFLLLIWRILCGKECIGRVPYGPCESSGYCTLDAVHRGSLGASHKECERLAWLCSLDLCGTGIYS